MPTTFFTVVPKLPVRPPLVSFLDLASGVNLGFDSSLVLVVDLSLSGVFVDVDSFLVFSVAVISGFGDGFGLSLVEYPNPVPV